MEENNLFKIQEQNYGADYKEHLFEQYKLFVASSERISDRRKDANKYFLTVNTGLIALIGISSQIEVLNNSSVTTLIIAIAGIIISIIFWHLLRSYKQLNTGKFKVIHEIEQRLPLSLYEYEWEALEKGENKEIYYPFSHIELLVPWVFGVLYVFLGIALFFI